MTSVKPSARDKYGRNIEVGDSVILDALDTVPESEVKVLAIHPYLVDVIWYESLTSPHMGINCHTSSNTTLKPVEWVEGKSYHRSDPSPDGDGPGHRVITVVKVFPDNGDAVVSWNVSLKVRRGDVLTAAARALFVEVKA